MKKHDDKLVTQEPTGQYPAFSSGFSIKQRTHQIQINGKTITKYKFSIY